MDYEAPGTFGRCLVFITNFVLLLMCLAVLLLYFITPGRHFIFLQNIYCSVILFFSVMFYVY